MNEFVQNLRQKPEHVRQRILIFTMAILMIAVIVIWFLTFGHRFSGKRETVTEGVSASPFSIFKNSFSKLISKESTKTNPIQNPDQSVEVTPIK